MYTELDEREGGRGRDGRRRGREGEEEQMMRRGWKRAARCGVLDERDGGRGRDGGRRGREGEGKRERG